MGQPWGSEGRYAHRLPPLPHLPYFSPNRTVFDVPSVIPPAKVRYAFQLTSGMPKTAWLVA